MSVYSAGAAPHTLQNMAELRSRRTEHLKLLILVLAFFGPLFAAMLIYFNPHWFTLPESASHGKLITPADPLAAFTAVSRGGRILPGSFLAGKWTLLYWNGTDCDLACEADLFKMRQVRLSLGKDIKRTQTVYLSSDAVGADLSRLLHKHPQLTAAHLKPGSAFAEQINAYPQKSIYVVDPLGNLMMSYSGDATSKGILEDLKKMLRISRIG